MQQNRGLGWLAPTPRLIVFVVLSTLFTLSSQWSAVLTSLVIGLVLLIAGGIFPRPALAACFSAFVLTFLGNALFAEKDIVASFLIFTVSTESLLNGLRLGLRLAAMILPAIAFVAVTPRYEYLDAFRGLHLPASAEMYLTIVLRYVDILWYDIQISMKAMAMRGVNWNGSITEKVSAFRLLMLPLIFRILEHIDAQSLAIDNRGGVSVVRHKPELTAGKAAVSIRHVYLRYDQGNDAEAKHALTDLNLEITPGQTTVLLGRTGAGKTSTLLLCTGLIPHSIGRMAGEVEIFGYNSKHAPLNQLGRLARIVFPSAVQGLVGLRVQDELELSLRVSDLEPDERRQAILDALHIVGLDDSFLPRLTLGLSGGEMQRVALASAIVAHPHLLALDDVTVQLDPVGKREVVAAIQSLRGQNITIVMCDPHIGLLDEVGHQFISLAAGQVTQQNQTVQAETITQASLRVPQMLRLGQALGLNLPIQPRQALSFLSTLAEAEPGRDALALTPTNEPQKIVVSAAGLTYVYPNGPKALDGVNLTFRQGEFVAILGSNGSGKTTTALLLAGAMLPSTGQVMIEGQPVDRNRHRGYIGYVFQEPTNQMVTMKVADELAFGPQQLGWAEAAVARAVERELARFELPAEAVPLHLPPAQARKLSIAATLTLNPRLVILDEPTNNLDEDEAQYLMAQLKALQTQGTTIVLITHDVEIACQYAERLIVMSRGHILADGPTRQVMTQLDLLSQSDVVPPPVVEVSLGLWPTQLPALTVEELASRLAEPALV